MHLVGLYIDCVPLPVCVSIHPSIHPSHRLDGYYMSYTLLVTKATKVNKDPDH